MLGPGQASRDIAAAAAAADEEGEEEGDQEEGERGQAAHQGQACRIFWGNDDDGLSRGLLRACCA
jgi:hypothetical protein